MLTSANETECQNFMFNNFVPLFCFSVKFVALEAYEVGRVLALFLAFVPCLFGYGEFTPKTIFVMQVRCVSIAHLGSPGIF